MKISIITVCYNSEKHIRTAIESVLSQKNIDLEYIIIDGNSSDSTVNIINDYISNLDYFISEPDLGIYDAMNKGLSVATGDVIGILNSDDFYTTDEVLSEVVDAFKINNLLELYLGNVDFVSPDNLKKIVRFFSSFHFKPWKMRYGFMPAHPAAFIKSSAYKKVGNYKINYKNAADFDIFVRMILVSKLEYQKVNQTLVRMRTGGASTSGFKSNLLSSYEILQSLKENNIYSNLLFIYFRLPIKLLYKTLHIFRSN